MPNDGEVRRVLTGQSLCQRVGVVRCIIRCIRRQQGFHRGSCNQKNFPEIFREGAEKTHERRVRNNYNNWLDDQDPHRREEKASTKGKVAQFRRTSLIVRLHSGASGEFVFAVFLPLHSSYSYMMAIFLDVRRGVSYNQAELAPFRNENNILSLFGQKNGKNVNCALTRVRCSFCGAIASCEQASEHLPVELVLLLRRYVYGAPDITLSQ